MFIKNIPSSGDFRDKADIILYDSMCNLLKLLHFGSVERIMIENVIINLSLSCESYLKSIIAEESPFLLLKIKSASNIKENFDEMYTIDAKELFPYVKKIKGDAFFDKKLNYSFCHIYHGENSYSIRSMRNSVAHSLNNKVEKNNELIMKLLEYSIAIQKQFNPCLSFRDWFFECEKKSINIYCMDNDFFMDGGCDGNLVSSYFFEFLNLILINKVYEVFLSHIVDYDVKDFKSFDYCEDCIKKFKTNFRLIDVGCVEKTIYKGKNNIIYLCCNKNNN